MRSDKFGSRLNRKGKIWFFTFLNDFVSWIGTKFWSNSFHLQNSCILQTKMDQREDTMKMNFDNFQIQKWISQTAAARKVDKVICLISFFSSWVMILRLPKILHFLQVCADLSKKSKSIIAIYSYLYVRPRHALSENSMFYEVLKNCSRDIGELNIK